LRLYFLLIEIPEAAWRGALEAITQSTINHGFKSLRAS
jgi:hypothetical protein